MHHTGRAEASEIVAWCAVAVLLALSLFHGQSLPRLGNDSFQYLAEAAQLQSAGHLATTIVYFDTERSYGTIPAPLTWFPPGYAALIVAVSATGFSLEQAALAVSLATFGSVAWLLWLLVRALGLSQWIARAAVIGWLTNSHAVTNSVSTMSELPFTALGLAGVLILVKWTGPMRLLAAAGVFGLSYWVRYAGLIWAFGFLCLAGYYFALCKQEKRPSRTAVISSIILLFLLLCPLMLRNILLIGDWRGGNNTPAYTPFREVGLDLVKAWFHLLVGDGSVKELATPLILIAIGSIGLGILAFFRIRFISMASSGVAGFVLGALSIYTIAIAVIASRSVISHDPRMYVPGLPLLISLTVYLAAQVVDPLRGRVRKVAFCSMICIALGYIAANWISLGRLGPDHAGGTRQALFRPDDRGRTIPEIVDEELRPGETIVSTNGQAVGYILKRPTLALAGSRYSLTDWNRPNLQAEMKRFGATHLLIFSDTALDQDLAGSEYLRSLADGTPAPADGLALVGSNGAVFLFRIVKQF